MKKNIQFSLVLILFLTQIVFIQPTSSTNIIDSPLPLSLPSVESTTSMINSIATNTSNNISPLGANDKISINTDSISKCIIEININIHTQKRLKLGVSKNSKTVYYDVDSIDIVSIPLQFGNGTYNIQLFENISNTSYNKIFQQYITLEISNEDQIFLNPSQIVNYTDSKELDSLIDSLIPTRSNEKEILEIAYSYLVKNFKYDYAKIPTLTTGYIPSVDDTILTQKGICYDYAVLLASILRSKGIPTKLIMGESTYTPTYHAWNEVFIAGEWIIIDTTMDAMNHDMGFPYQMIKNTADYETDLFY